MFQAGFWTFVAALPASLVLYQLSQPDKNGNPPAITRWINSYWYFNEQWEERSHRHTKLIEQAAQDKNLFFSAERKTRVELKNPE
jgi:hypothetical protein